MIIIQEFQTIPQHPGDIGLGPLDQAGRDLQSQARQGLYQISAWSNYRRNTNPSSSHMIMGLKSLRGNVWVRKFRLGNKGLKV